MMLHFASLWQVVGGPYCRMQFNFQMNHKIFKTSDMPYLHDGLLHSVGLIHYYVCYHSGVSFFHLAMN